MAGPKACQRRQGPAIRETFTSREGTVQPEVVGPSSDAPNGRYHPDRQDASRGHREPARSPAMRRRLSAISSFWQTFRVAKATRLGECRADLGRGPEKWKPVFRKGHGPN